MKISILTSDLSHNCLGRAYLLAKILQRRYTVEIAGPIFGDGIWPPVVYDNSIAYKFVTIKNGFRPYSQFGKLIESIDGDVIYASKPLFFSFGAGLIKKMRGKKPLVLDIDDWEMGFVKSEYDGLPFLKRMKSFIYSGLYLYQNDTYWNTWLSEKLTRFADDITVSNTFLEGKFGGTIIYHGRDTHAFNPEKFEKGTLRREYGIDACSKVIMFFGTPRPHKGVEDLIDAMALIKDKDVILVVAGLDNLPYCQGLLVAATGILKDRFRGFGIQPFEKVPEFLALADIVVIPQRRSVATFGQLPAKVFDAMALAKPIVATQVSDLPEILRDCGLTVEPENIGQLADAIRYLLEEPKKAEELGKKAREKCIEKYSWDTIEKILMVIFRKYEHIKTA